MNYLLKKPEYVTHFVQKRFRNAQKLAKCERVFGSARKSFGFFACHDNNWHSKFACVPRNETDSVNVLKICQTGTNETTLSRGFKNRFIRYKVKYKIS